MIRFAYVSKNFSIPFSRTISLQWLGFIHRSILIGGSIRSGLLIYRQDFSHFMVILINEDHRKVLTFRI